MSKNNRREFLADVGQGMLVASLGTALATDLGMSPALADETSRLTFGSMEPLVALMQDTPPDKLQPILIDKIKSGTTLKTLIAAGALSNARSFGGQDYVGFHTAMALMPAWEMSKQMPSGSSPLPVLKVLYRNSERIQEHGGKRSEVLKPVASGKSGQSSEPLKAAVLRGDMSAAEKVFRGVANAKPRDAYNHLIPTVQLDGSDVHRVALAWRAWDVLNLTGMEHAHTLLRQSVRYCVEQEQHRRRRNRPAPTIRTILPKLMDQYKLANKKLGKRRGDDQWLTELTNTIFIGSHYQACEAVAIALSEGYSVESVAEAIALASTRLVLNDPGRSKDRGKKGHSRKPKGSVHGDSIGVHASDAANAWWNIARVSNHVNSVASLICGAYHTAGQGRRVRREPYPFVNELDQLQSKDAQQVIRLIEEAIKDKQQAMASACVARYAQLQGDPRAIFRIMLKYAVSQDGALHAEKYYQTVSEEFVSTRRKFRWQHLTALARVTASEYGWAAPGHSEATRLLKG